MPKTLAEIYMPDENPVEISMYTVREVKKILFGEDNTVHDNTLYGMCQSGQLGHRHIGKKYVFYQHHVDAYLGKGGRYERFECFWCEEKIGIAQHAY